MSRAVLRAPEPLEARHFALLRIALGVYLALHFALQIPYAGELYSAEGMLADASLNVTGAYLPYPPFVFASAGAAQGLLATLSAIAALFALGVLRRTAALAIWLGLVLLLHRNNLTFNVSLPYLGWLLLATCLVPRGEGGLLQPRDDRWSFPRPLVWGAWLVFGLSYSYSGAAKFGSPEWTEGSALSYVMNQPLAYSFSTAIAQSMPDVLMRLATWTAAGLELLCAPLLLLAPTRVFAWVGLTLLQIGILLTLQITEVSLGLLLFHALLVDPTWLRRARLAGSSSAPIAA